MKSVLISVAFAASALTALAQPRITSVTNAASYTPDGLPHAGITQGAMFVIKGTNLGPATYDVANTFPLTTTRAGTSVSVTVGGQTSSAIIYYAGAAQVAAILRSATPLGTGTLTVTAGGQTSATFPITVVRGALGIFTVSQSGSGDAIATLPNNTIVSPTNSANAGEAVAFWGTGLGAVTGDETAAAQQADLTGIAVQAFVGGRTANVVFRGRNACCTAVDTIYVTIPAGASGCAVPAVFIINGIVSNTTSLPVAASGRTCAPTQPGVSATDFTSLLNGGTFTAGTISLSRSTSTTPPIVVGGMTVPGTGGTTKSDSGFGSFIKLTVPQGGLGATGQFDIASYGACLVTVFSNSGINIPGGGSYQFLDAGPSLSLTGPGGAKTLAKQTTAGFISYGGDLDQTGNYLTAGQYTVAGPGGADVGAFSVSATLAAPLTWNNQSSITTVTRANGVTVTWSGGDPAGYTQIQGSSSAILPGNQVSFAQFTCTARTSDGTFTVPPNVLLALPASASTGGISIPTGGLSVSSYSNVRSFSAPGIQYGTFLTYSTNSGVVTYQ